MTAEPPLPALPPDGGGRDGEGQAGLLEVPSEVAPPESVLPPEVAAVMRDSPMLKAWFQSIERYTGPPQPPKELLAKITSQHISTLLEQSGRAEDQRAKETLQGRCFNLGYFLVGLVAVFAMVFLILNCSADMPTKDKFLDKGVTAVLGIVGGLGGGYWLGSRRQRD